MVCQANGIQKMFFLQIFIAELEYPEFFNETLAPSAGTNKAHVVVSFSLPHSLFM